MERRSVKQWEYLGEVWEWHGMASFIDYLNEMGKLGWRKTEIIMDTPARLRVFFEREMPAGITLVSNGPKKRGRPKKEANGQAESE